MKVKLNEEIKEFCNILKLKGIHDHFDEVIEESQDYEEFLHKLLFFEIDEKDKRGIDCRIRNAKFPYRKYLEDIDIRCLPEIQGRVKRM